MGLVVTFYSYKGGVGRSMAVANVGVLLAQWGFDVLVIDFDLEAPGLEGFFWHLIEIPKARERRGLVDFLCAFLIDNGALHPCDWTADPITIPLPRTSGRLELWSAGIRNKDYFQNVRRLDFPELYANSDGGTQVESVRRELKKKYDFVLVDSRTGLTDIGGICTVQLPDLIVLLFSATNQAFEGGLEIVKKASASRQRLPFERTLVPTVPVPSRFDTQAELRLSQKWLDRFAKDLQDVYSAWLPKDVRARDLLEIMKLPHVSFFTFGESLPVLESGTNDPSGLGYAYENLAALVARNLEGVELLLSNRDEYVRGAAREDPIPASRDSLARVFVSYHHRDREWVERLRTHLLPLMNPRALSLWDDTQIQPGSVWKEEISKAISAADIALVLVSPDYLASEFIRNAELPMLLKAAEDRGLRIAWLAVRPSLVAETQINSFQSLHSPNEPLSSLSSDQLDHALVSVARRISDGAGRTY